MSYLKRCSTLGNGTLHLHADPDSGVISLVEHVPGHQGSERKFEVLLSEWEAFKVYKALGRALEVVARKRNNPQPPGP